MSQEYSSRRQRRSNRTRGSRPVLVTPSATSTIENESSPVASETTGTESTRSTNNGSVADTESRTVPTPAPTEQRRLPRFFSNVSKSEQETQTNTGREQTAVQARIARATRGRALSAPTARATDSETSETTEEKSGEKPPRIVPAKSAAQTTTRPATKRPAQTGFFKTRYIIGLGIYLIVADFVGVYEANLLTQFGLERQLAAFNLFGLPIQVRTSTLVFLLTLIIVLVVLAYFDLLPRSLGAASGRTTGSTGRSGSTSSSTPAERTPQPTMRQGVKGTDDDLYQAYRSKQRRARKR